MCSRFLYVVALFDMLPCPDLRMKTARSLSWGDSRAVAPRVFELKILVYIMRTGPIINIQCKVKLESSSTDLFRNYAQVTAIAHITF